MTTLRLATITLPSADVGDTNPLPPLRFRRQVEPAVADDDIDGQMRANMGYGHVGSTLPYLTQDRYDRTRKPARHRVAVLENHLLRAEFLLDLGGRLRSLVDVSDGRELLYVNPALQPANLALRDAWFAGGVEWNIGMRGHSPLTCSPLHAARIDGPDGVPVLRMWEYERIREVVFSIDAWLLDDTPVLAVAVRIVNPNEHDVPMYWWSNIAVPQESDVRVLAPGDSAWRSDETATVDVVDLPGTGRKDHTYPQRATGAADYFMRMDAGHRPWVAAVDGTGRGLAQSSTAELTGRKLFVWGGSTGGRHWQEWLSHGGQYFEIQSGLLHTQLEHTPMPPGAQWSWVETYGPIHVDPAVVHGGDWSAAREETEQHILQLVPDARLSQLSRHAQDLATAPPAELLHRGSGWGALERLLRGASALDRPATPFSLDTLQAEQSWWADLLRGVQPRTADPSTAPLAYQVGPRWAALLEASGRDDWMTWLLRGVARHHAGDLQNAAEAWKRSTAAAANPWALRNLAAVEHDTTTAATLLTEAVAVAPTEPALLVELMEALLADGRPADALLAVAADADTPRTALVRFLEARASVDTGDTARAHQILARVPMAWVGEGSHSLDRLWFRMQAHRVARNRGTALDDALMAHVEATAPLPYYLDFRMTPTGGQHLTRDAPQSGAANGPPIQRTSTCCATNG